MSSTVTPAMRGTFGNIEYFIVTMPAQELTSKLVIPKEVEGWQELSIEEQYQREINYRRVKSQIAPYLVADDDRFFGAFIVTVINHEQMGFEPLTDIFRANVPNLYRDASKAFGFLTMSGQEVLVPLDGQHRLAALKFAITGKDEKQAPIIGLDSDTSIAQDTCTVMLIRHEPDKSRKIFNKVNRYAKPTTKAENLITADDDVVAVIVREDIVGSEHAIPDAIVNFKSNTLNASSGYFTTLATLYESTKFLLEDTHGKINTNLLPPKSERVVYREQAQQFWETVCSEVDLFRDAIHDSSETGNERRKQIRADYVLGRPVAQWALVQAIVRLYRPDKDSGFTPGLRDICQRVNALDWRVDAPRWQYVLMTGDKMLAGRTVVNVAGRIIAYWLGEVLSDGEIQELNERYSGSGASGRLAPPMEVV